jgi:hypothetical protein
MAHTWQDTLTELTGVTDPAQLAVIEEWMRVGGCYLGDLHRNELGELARAARDAAREVGEIPPA